MPPQRRRLVNAYVLTPHHLDHLLPVWEALDPEARDHLYVGFDQQTKLSALRRGVEPHLGVPPESDTPVLVASGNELPAVKRAVLCEHGIGQTYLDISHVCWPGGPSRDNVTLFLCPNERVAQANRATYPDTPCAVVGSPHMEILRRLPPFPKKEQIVAFSSHWDAGHLCPELRSGWAWFENAYEKLCREHPDDYVLHGHPRMQDYTAWKAREWGVEHVADFAELTQRAWLYVTDNSSTAYEWAALDRPVVLVSPPWYRRDVEHGLRFWEYDDIGPQCFNGDELPAALLLADGAGYRRRRQLVSHSLFGEDLSDGAAARAARAIEGVL